MEEEKQSPQDQHIFHHHAADGPRVVLKLEKNMKGYNWEINVSGAMTVKQAFALLREGDQTMRSFYRE